MVETNKKIKIAVVSDDGETVSQHFGRARYFAIFEIDDGKITGKEIRNKVGHHTFAEQGHLGTSGGLHGYEPHSQDKHETMAQSIEDCSVLIAGGMGYGAYEFFKSMRINVITTDVADAEDAVKKYLRGELRDLKERLD
jgi:predicted Fe-Mo cluster-binding NifX family protein